MAEQGPRGWLFILVGPGGAGKNTLMRTAIEHYGGLTQLATATTRPIRDGEQEGREHYFVSLERFKQMIANNDLLEHQEVTPGKFYGVPRDRVADNLNAGRFIIADIDVIGAEKVQAAFPQDVVLIFITVPGDSIEEKLAVLRERMSNEDRNEDEKLIRDRLQRAQDIEFKFAQKCDHVIVNDDVSRAEQELIDIIRKYQLQRTPQS